MKTFLHVGHGLKINPLVLDLIMIIGKKFYFDKNVNPDLGTLTDMKSVETDFDAVIP